MAGGPSADDEYVALVIDGDSRLRLKVCFRVHIVTSSRLIHYFNNLYMMPARTETSACDSPNAALVPPSVSGHNDAR